MCTQTLSEAALTCLRHATKSVDTAQIMKHWRKAAIVRLRCYKCPNLVLNLAMRAELAGYNNTSIDFIFFLALELGLKKGLVQAIAIICWFFLAI